MTSFLPHSKRRPSTSLSLSRTLSAAGSTPRIGTLASVPVERLGRLMMTKSSAEASEPSAVRATPGASAMTRVLSRRKPLTISLSAPLRRTIAASGEPEAVRALRKPTPIESTPDQDGDYTGNAEHGGGDRPAPLRDAQQAELADGGDLRKPVNGTGHKGEGGVGRTKPDPGDPNIQHPTSNIQHPMLEKEKAAGCLRSEVGGSRLNGYIRRRASATRRRMAWRAGKMPASTPRATLNPTPISTSRVGNRKAAACRRWGRHGQSTHRPRPAQCRRRALPTGRIQPAPATAPASW